MAWFNFNDNQWYTQKGGTILAPDPGQESVIQIVPLNKLEHLPTQVKSALRFKQALQDVEDNIYEPIEIYVYSDDSLEIGDGNHRLEAARQLGRQNIKVVFVYVD